MNRLFASTWLVPLFLLLTACSSGTLWSHPSKSLTDLHVNSKECSAIALGKAKSQSLTDQPILTAQGDAYNQCMIAQGWVPTSSNQQASAPFSPVNIAATNTSIRLTTDDRQIELKGKVQLLSERPYGALFTLGNQAVQIDLQHNSIYTMLPIFPVLKQGAETFARFETAKSKATSFYLEVNGKLVFGCIAYIFAEKNSRVVLTISEEISKMPKDFLAISQQEFAKLQQKEAEWKKLIESIEQQL